MGLGRILVPLDGSALAERALPFVEQIPSQEVCLLAVEPMPLTAARQRWARGEEPPGGGTWRVTSTRAYLALLGKPVRAQGRDVAVVVT